VFAPGREYYGRPVSAQDLLQYAAWALFLVVFVATLAQAIRHPRRSTVDTALLFGAAAAIIIEGSAAALFQLKVPEFESDAVAGLLLALPYLLLRLAQDFSHVPGWLMRLAEAGLAVSVVAIFVTHDPRDAWVDLLILLYFILLTLYTTVAFIVAALASGGVTRRRLTAVGLGSGFLALDLAIAGVGLALPQLSSIWTAATGLCGLGAGLGYYLGFAPPRWLRRAWQEPELRAFLAQAAELPRMRDTRAIVAAIEEGARRSLGAYDAAFGRWDAEQRLLLYDQGRGSGDSRGTPLENDVIAFKPESLIVGQALLAHRTMFTDDTTGRIPGTAELNNRTETRTLLAAPVTVGDQTLGVLSAYARATIFAEEDLELLQLLADQAAVILESRKLIDQAAEVRAREEATRLKDDFLSAAAHDLKTPLTSLVGHAQLLARQASRNDGRVEPRSLEIIQAQSARLRSLVDELLDANRVERGLLADQREPGDLLNILIEVCVTDSKSHRIVIEASEPLKGQFDLTRMRQLFMNLTENAVKYSPEGGEVLIKASVVDGAAYVTVSDPGIGIPPAELPRIFERFHRGANVNDRTYPGMGLGLYICHGIVEDHGGRIWASSQPGNGTTMHVSLPLGG
jgi:signal transduction histidine kinase